MKRITSHAIRRTKGSFKGCKQSLTDKPEPWLSKFLITLTSQTGEFKMSTL